MTNPTDPPAKLSEGEFIRLFVVHEPALRAFARSILPDWNTVDDALQEASVTMWEKLDQLRNEEGFLPWAKVILRFKCLSTITKLRRNQSLLGDDVLKLIADEAQATDTDDVKAVQLAMKNCFAEFSQPHQELLLAPYAGDGRVKQLAQIGGASVNSYYKLLGRLREKLGDCVRRNIEPGAV